MKCTKTAFNYHLITELLPDNYHLNGSNYLWWVYIP